MAVARRAVLEHVRDSLAQGRRRRRVEGFVRSAAVIHAEVDVESVAQECGVADLVGEAGAHLGLDDGTQLVLPLGDCVMGGVELFLGPLRVAVDEVEGRLLAHRRGDQGATDDVVEVPRYPVTLGVHAQPGDLLLGGAEFNECRRQLRECVEVHRHRDGHQHDRG